MHVNLTDTANAQISKLCSNPNTYVRLAVLAGGCNGYTKVFDITSVIEKDDLKIDCATGALLIDPISLELLDGSTVDYKNELIGSFFKVSIPTATSMCGCGDSFAI